MKKKIGTVILLLGIIGGIFVNLWATYGPKNGGSRLQVESFMDKNEAYHATHEETQAALKELEGIQAFRYEQNKTDILYNSAMLNELNGGQFYFSLAPMEVGSFFEENYLDGSLEQRFSGLNNRSWLLKLFSMRYYAGREGNIPYGFKKVEGIENLTPGIDIYEDKNPLPFAYTYDKAISQETYEKLEPQKKQEAMLQGVVLEKSGLPECEPEYTSKEVPFTMEWSKGVQLEGNSFHVKKKRGSCILSVEGLENCETYVSFQGLEYVAPVKEPDAIFEKSTVNRADIFARVPGDNNNNVQTIILRTPWNNFQSGRSCFMMNMGYRAEKVTKIRLFFSRKGVYNFDEMNIVCQKMDTLNQYTTQRNADAPQNLKAEENDVSCDITLDKKKALVFSIPYNKGWSLKVDGKAAELKQANGMFMAVELDAGTHRVELHYVTPYIKAGAWMSFTGVVLVFIIYRRRKKEKNSLNQLIPE